MANGYGGARKGAGRPKASVRVLERVMKQAEGRAILNVAQHAQEFLEKRLPQYLNNLDAIADGILVKDNNGVYADPPDRMANTSLIDRYLGKPTARVEGRGEVIIRIVYEKRPRMIEGSLSERQEP